MNDQQRPQDPMVRTRSTSKKKNSKGGDWLLLYVDEDQVQLMIDALQACVGNPRGARLDLHTNQKVADGGRTFDSTIIYVKPCQEQQQGGFGGGGQQQPRQQYAPRGAQTPQTRERVQQAYGNNRPAPASPPQQRQYQPRQPQQPTQPAQQDTGFAPPSGSDEEVPF